MKQPLTSADVATLMKRATQVIQRTTSRYGWRISKDDLADLVQETATRCIAAFDPAKGEIGALAYMAGMNVATDYLRGGVSCGVNRRLSNEASMVGTDDDGNESMADFADGTMSAFDTIAMAERSANLANAIADLSDAQRSAIEADLDDQSLDNAQRQNKFRAVENLADSLRSSHFVRRAGKAPKAVKVGRTLKVAIEPVEPPAQLGLSTLKRWEYQVAVMGLPSDIQRMA